MAIRYKLTVILGALAFALPLSTIANASAERPESGNQESITVYSGIAQSSDPTRWDYVPAESLYNNRYGDGNVQPMTASGSSVIGGFPITVGPVTIDIPKTVLNHKIYGSGLAINSEAASFTSFSVICNYQIRFQNRWGGQIYSDVGTSVYGSCTTGTGDIWRTNLPTVAKTGLQCARLYSNGYYIGEQCHQMTG